MKNLFHDIKYWLKTNPKVKTGLIIGFAVVCAFIIFRIISVNLVSETTEEEVDPLASIELSSEQSKLVNSYSDDDKKFLENLLNNKGTDISKSSYMFFNEKQIIERKNNEETAQTYALCGIEKNFGDNQSSEEVYRFTALLGSNEYRQGELHIEYEGKTVGGGIKKMYILGDKLFKSADSYERCEIAEKIEIENGDNGVSALIEQKDDLMNAKLKDYMYFYYPYIGKVSGNGIAGINYYRHTISLNFSIELNRSNTVFVIAEYNRDSQTFDVGKGQNAESLEIKKTGM